MDQSPMAGYFGEPVWFAGRKVGTTYNLLESAMNPSMKRSMMTVLLSAGLLVLASCSGKSPEPTAGHSETAAYQKGVPGAVVVETHTVAANVVAVHPTSRELVLDGPDGRRFTVVCGPARPVSP